MEDCAGAENGICARRATGLVGWGLALIAAVLGVGVWCPGSAVAFARSAEDTRAGGWAIKVSASEKSSKTSPRALLLPTDMPRAVLTAPLACVHALMAPAHGLILESRDSASPAVRRASAVSEAGKAADPHSKSARALGGASTALRVVFGVPSNAGRGAGDALAMSSLAKKMASGA
jgi:hypothetical protein